MKKVIAFSLWGNNPKYTVGAIRNAQIAQKLFPDWECWFYIGNGVPDQTIEILEELPNTKCIQMSSDSKKEWQGMYWRFLPASDPTVDVMISRDTDSRLSKREKAAIDEWLDSDRGFHVMRDHPAHCIGILGGLWGAKRGCIPEMKDLIEQHITKENRWGIDQDFLVQHIEQKVNKNWMEHDSFYGIEARDNYKLGFPTPRDKNTMFFVGQPFNEKEQPEITLSNPGTDR